MSDELKERLRIAQEQILEAELLEKVRCAEAEVKRLKRASRYWEPSKVVCYACYDAAREQDGGNVSARCYPGTCTRCGGSTDKGKVWRFFNVSDGFD